MTASTTANASEPDPLITEMQEWAQFTGDGVDATPYGLPIDFESDVVRRNVEWLPQIQLVREFHPNPRTGWNNHTSRVCF